ncbi:hypothetical protein [Accumulibacter sp.]|nr:hypothetical protein [Accumulibacter sp.]HRF03293.1 hypothetical protein [Accumulibacter sp.]
MSRFIPAGLFLGALLLTGCGTVDVQPPARAVSDPPDSRYAQSPDPTVSVEPGKAVALVGAVAYGASAYTGPAANLGLAAAAVIATYVVYDPLAPNWTIEERMVGRNTYLLSMRAKSFRTGGDGESGLILKRRALQLQRKGGFLGYLILDYSEGIESSTPFTHRYAEATFQLLQSDPEKAP